MPIPTVWKECAGCGRRRVCHPDDNSPCRACECPGKYVLTTVQPIFRRVAR